MATHKRGSRKSGAADRTTAETTATTKSRSRASRSPVHAYQIELPSQSALAQLSLGFATLPPGTPVHIATPAGASKRPSKPGGGVRQKFDELRAALADGWEIVQPIFARPLWSVSDDSTTAFNFVLRRERATRLLTVPEGRTVERFIRDQQLIVDYRR